jgi:hypothetical protein
MSIDIVLYKIAVWYSLDGVNYDAIYNTSWKYNGNIEHILMDIVITNNCVENKRASILPSDIPSISVLGLKTTSTARINLSNMRCYIAVSENRKINT